MLNNSIALASQLRIKYNCQINPMIDMVLQHVLTQNNSKFKQALHHFSDEFELTYQIPHLLIQCLHNLSIPGNFFDFPLSGLTQVRSLHVRSNPQDSLEHINE